VTWVKLDDQFPEHPKIARVGSMGLALHVQAICYSARNLTDGLIPAGIVPRLTELKTKQALDMAERMVGAGLWERCGDDFRVHDYLVYNPARADVLAKRAKDSARKIGGSDADSKRPDPLLTPDPDPVPNPLEIEEVRNALFERANRVAARPELDTSGEQPFVKAFREHFQQREGKDPPRNQVADARALEREYGAERCLQLATDYDWAVAPGYLRQVLENPKNGNGSGEGRGKSGQTPSAGGVADRVSGLDRRRAAVAARG
jgi:hypothetical protein